MARVRHSVALGSLLRAVGACGLLVGAFFLAPVEPGTTGAYLVVRFVLAVLTVALVALLIGRLVVRLVQGHPGTRPASLLVALFGGLVVFAFVDYLVAISDPEQFVDLETKVDALYFAVSTLATVGFGDVAASGQLARVVVTVQQLFNLAVIATGGTVLVNRIVADRGAEAGPRGTSRPS